jgi:hypothetical protein
MNDVAYQLESLKHQQQRALNEYIRNLRAKENCQIRFFHHAEPSIPQQQTTGDQIIEHHIITLQNMIDRFFSKC